MNVEVAYDESMPTHMLVIAASGDDVRVTCHPDVEAQAVAPLSVEVAAAVLGADRELSVDEAVAWLGGDES
jgi:hypothetical protein